MILVVAVLLALFVLPSPWGLVAVVVAGAVEVVETLFWLWLSRRGRVQMGPETIVGSVGVVAAACRPSGQVRLQGELWTARCPGGADEGERVRVTALEGNTLVVEPAA
jgi:membrane protein implicated in regulation of membrane protease activity